MVEDSRVIEGLEMDIVDFRLLYILDLVARKLEGPEKSKLEDADIAFHESEYRRLRGGLQVGTRREPTARVAKRTNACGFE